MRGSNTGVFMSTFQCEAQELFTADPQQIKGYEMTGCARSMLANRLSFYFDFHGKILVTSPDTATIHRKHGTTSFERYLLGN